MSERVISVRLFFDDFESGIVELKPIERAVYLTLCLRFYATFGSVVDDDRTLARASNCSLQAYRKAKNVLLERGKIEVIDGHIWQHKCAKELGDAQDRLRKWNLWKSKKDAKKMQKSSQFGPKKPNEFIEGESTTVTVGYDTPKGVNRNLTKEAQTELKSQSDAQPPARESGGGLASDTRVTTLIDAIKKKHGPSLSLRDVDTLKAHIVSASETTLTVDRAFWESSEGQRLVGKAESAGVTIEPQTELRLIAGGKT